MMRAAVLGSPVAHSLSPTLHRAAYAELGLDWRYDAIECDEQGLSGLLAGLDATWAGLSLTMPLKRAALELLDEVSPLAAAVGGANTVVVEPTRLRGENTDVGGAVDALREHGVVEVDSAVLLGAGATAAAMLAVLAELGLSAVDVVVRDPARTSSLRAAAERLGMPVRVHAIDGLAGLLPADLCVSTLPARAADSVAEAAASARTVFDVCYEPWPTLLALHAKRTGAGVVGGFELLLHQAAGQVRLMTGRREVPVAAMRTAGERVLASRGTVP